MTSNPLFAGIDESLPTDEQYKIMINRFFACAECNRGGLYYIPNFVDDGGHDNPRKACVWEDKVVCRTCWDYYDRINTPPPRKIQREPCPCCGRKDI